MYINFNCWSFSNLEICTKNHITTDLYFWTFVGPTIMIKTIAPLWNSENGHGSKFYPMTRCTSWENYEKLRAVGYGQVKKLHSMWLFTILFVFFSFNLWEPKWWYEPLILFTWSDTAIYSSLSRWWFSNLEIFAKNAAP